LTHRHRRQLAPAAAPAAGGAFARSSGSSRDLSSTGRLPISARSRIARGRTPTRPGGAASTRTAGATHHQLSGPPFVSRRGADRANGRDFDGDGPVFGEHLEVGEYGAPPMAETDSIAAPRAGGAVADLASVEDPARSADRPVRPTFTATVCVPGSDSLCITDGGTGRPRVHPQAGQLVAVEPKARSTSAGGVGGARMNASMARALRATASTRACPARSCAPASRRGVVDHRHEVGKRRFRTSSTPVR
jgi:hypothetical protein